MVRLKLKTVLSSSIIYGKYRRRAIDNMVEHTWGGGWASLGLLSELFSPAAMPKYALPVCLLSTVVHRWIMLGSEKNRSWFESYHRPLT